MKPTWILAAAFLTNATLIPTLAQARTEIQNKGSDTLVNVAQAWAEAYQKVDPEVAVAVSGGGSGTGIAALINGTVDIANASRKMKDKEIYPMPSINFWKFFTDMLASDEHAFWVATGLDAKSEKSAYKEWLKKERTEG